MCGWSTSALAGALARKGHAHINQNVGLRYGLWHTEPGSPPAGRWSATRRTDVLPVLRVAPQLLALQLYPLCWGQARSAHLGRRRCCLNSLADGLPTSKFYAAMSCTSLP